MSFVSSAPKALRLRVMVLALGVLCAPAATRTANAADLTRGYLAAYANPCAYGTAHHQALRAHNVLLVPGYLSGQYPDAFRDQLRWLDANGVTHQKVAVTSGDSVEVNGAIIAAAIRASAKPVILITHSKGSVDTLQALLAEPALRGNVKGWISLQGAFLGSPVADKLLDGQLLNPLFATLILGFFGGTRSSAQDLTTAASRAYVRKHQAAIAQLLREVPAVAFASAVDGAGNARVSPTLEIPYDMMAREGIRNDGLVPLEAAVLPGMDFVKVSGVDHIAPILATQQPFNRVRMTQALLLTLRTPLRELPPDSHCKPAR